MYNKWNEEENENCYLVRPISEILSARDYDWVVKNAFAKQFISFIFGEAGSGKTWLIQDLLLKLAKGEDVFDGIEVETSKVLLIEGDTTDSLLKERYKLMGAEDDIIWNNDNFFYVNKYTVEANYNTNLDLVTDTGKRNFVKCISSTNCDFVVIDTLISFINNESDQVEMLKAIQFLRNIATKYNCHILICHHSRKKESGDRSTKLMQSDMIGTSVLNRLAGFIIAVEKTEVPTNKLEGNIKVVKSWFNEISPIHFSLEQNINDSTLKIQYKTCDENVSDIQQAKQLIKDYIKTNNLNEFKRKDIRDRYTQLPDSRIKRALVELENNGYIKGVGNTNSRVFEVIYPEYNQMSINDTL